MKQWFTNKSQDAVMQRMQALIFLLSSVAVFSLAWQTSVANLELKNLDFWQWVNLWIGIVGLWTNNVISLLYKAQSRIAEGKPPMGEGNTEIFTKTESITKTDSFSKPNTEIPK